ncbi:hypothetical protein ACQ4PT_071800 [Festuca glaucescens]
MGRLIGKTKQIDMAYTRAHGVVRALVKVVDITKIPYKKLIFHEDEGYYLTIEIEDDAAMSEDDDPPNGDDKDNRTPSSSLSLGSGATAAATTLSASSPATAGDLSSAVAMAATADLLRAFSAATDGPTACTGEVEPAVVSSSHKTPTSVAVAEEMKNVSSTSPLL